MNAEAEKPRRSGRGAVTLETLALSNVREGWKRGLEIELERGRQDYPMSIRQRAILKALAEEKPLEHLDEVIAYGSVLVILINLATRGLVRPSDDGVRIEVTNYGRELAMEARL